MENQAAKMSFNMDELKANLPQKSSGGLSRYYSGKSRSFASMADVHCVEDLQKQEPILDAKKRKKYSDRKKDSQIAPYPCRRASSTQIASLRVACNNQSQKKFWFL